MTSYNKRRRERDFREGWGGASAGVRGG